jgi:hypothetical protein
MSQGVEMVGLYVRDQMGSGSRNKRFLQRMSRRLDNEEFVLWSRGNCI